MKLVRTLLPVLACALLAASAAAQDASLDNLWFKLSAKTKGLAITAGPDTVKSSSKDTIYLHLALPPLVADGVPGSTTYDFQVWCQTSTDTWEIKSEGEVEVQLGGDDYVLPALPVVDQNPDADVNIGGTATLRIHVKRDKAGNVTSAKLTTLGGEVTNGGTSDGFLFSNLVLSGKSVPEEKVPFAAT